MAEIFNFEDFFVGASDPGSDASVAIGGRTVPLKIKRALTLQDMEESKAAAVKTKLVNGELEVVSIDETEFAMQILERAILSWPFTMPDGSAVPVTRENLQAMMVDGAQALQALALALVQKRPDTAPFVQPSAGA